MADNLQIPNNLTKVIKIIETDKVLKDFLTNLLNDHNQLKERVTMLETRVTELEN